MRKTMILLGFLALAPFAKGQLLLEALDRPDWVTANCQPELEGTWIIVDTGQDLSGIGSRNPHWLQCRNHHIEYRLSGIAASGWTWARFLEASNTLYVPTYSKININDKTIVVEYISGLDIFPKSQCGYIDTEPGAWFRPSKGCPIVGFADYFNGPIHSLPKTER